LNFRPQTKSGQGYITRPLFAEIEGMDGQRGCQPGPSIPIISQKNQGEKMNSDSQQNNEIWAIVELFGHQCIAGRYSEHGAFIRIDVPDSSEPGRMKFIRLYGQNAIYSITFVDEETARCAARHLDMPAITVNIPLVKIIAPPGHPEFEYDEREYDDDEDTEEYSEPD
jgi:hypothetical protein